MHERPAQVLHLAVAGVVPGTIAGQERAERVVEVVVPLGVRAVSPGINGRDEPGIVRRALGDQVDASTKGLRAPVHGLRELLDKGHGRGVHDGMDGVEPQCIHAARVEPPERAPDEEPPDLVRAGSVEVERPSPRRVVPIREVRTERVEVVPLRPEVVVHHVEHDGEAARVAGVHQTPEPVRSAVRALCRVGADAVIPPVARAGKLRDRHELDRRDAQVAQLVQLRDRGVERALGRERADVQLIDHITMQRKTDPLFGLPLEFARHDLRRPVHALRLGARGGIRERVAAFEREPVAGARRHVVGDKLEVPALGRMHRGARAVLAHELDAFGLRRPDTETRAPIGERDRAEMLGAVSHGMRSAWAGRGGRA